MKKTGQCIVNKIGGKRGRACAFGTAVAFAGSAKGSWLKMLLQEGYSGDFPGHPSCLFILHWAHGSSRTGRR